MVIKSCDICHDDHSSDLCYKLNMIYMSSSIKRCNMVKSISTYITSHYSEGKKHFWKSSLWPFKNGKVFQDPKLSMINNQYDMTYSIPNISKCEVSENYSIFDKISNMTHPKASLCNNSRQSLESGFDESPDTHLNCKDLDLHSKSLGNTYSIASEGGFINKERKLFYPQTVTCMVNRTSLDHPYISSNTHILKSQNNITERWRHVCIFYSAYKKVRRISPFTWVCNAIL